MFLFYLIIAFSGGSPEVHKHGILLASGHPLTGANISYLLLAMLAAGLLMLGIRNLRR